MKRSNTIGIKDLIKQAVETNRLNDGLDKVKVLKLWRNVAGEYTANATTDIYIADSKLFVKVNSSIIRSEILLIRSELRNRINKEIGRDFIREIVVR